MKTRYPSTRLMEVVSKYYHKDCDGLSADGMLEIILKAELGSCDLDVNDQIGKVIEVLDKLDIPYELCSASDHEFALRKYTYFYFANHHNMKLKVLFDHWDTTFFINHEITSWQDTLIFIIKNYISTLQEKHESECRQISAYEMENRELKRRLAELQKKSSPKRIKCRRRR